MKLAPDDPHKEFFQQNKAIEFEEVFSNEEIQHLKEGIKNLLSKRLKVPASKILSENAHRLFEVGRDLWRNQDEVRKFSLNRRLAEIAFQLTEERPIRIGYDQYFPKMDKASKFIQGKYDKFFDRSFSLEEFCSLQGLICGVLVCLNDREGAELSRHIPKLPSKVGNALFLHPKVQVNWPGLFKDGVNEYYLIVYGAGTCLYALSSQDPLSRFLMREGYVAGDRLNDTSNPIVFR